MQAISTHKISIKSIGIFLTTFLVLNYLLLFTSISQRTSSFYSTIYNAVYSKIYEPAGLSIQAEADVMVIKFFNKEKARAALKLAKQKGIQGVSITPKRFDFKPNYNLTLCFIFMWSLLLALPLKNTTSKIKSILLGSLLFFGIYSFGFYFIIKNKISRAGIGMYETAGVGTKISDTLSKLFDSFGFLSFIILLIVAYLFYKKK